MRILFGVLLAACLSIQSQAQTGDMSMAEGRVDHNSFDQLLKQYVDEDGYVDYRRLKANDMKALDAYLVALGEVDPLKLADRDELLAFWINAYNALTIRGILHFYPTRSIRDHVSILGYNIWKDYKTNVAGVDYSLDHIEHKILRKMDEPRIHFAIVCASIGCPKLLNEAYTAARIEAQLHRSTVDFFADPGKLRIDYEAGTVWQSPIMDWYKDDFGRDQTSRLAFIKPFLTTAETRAFLDRAKVRVKELDYDWKLNDQASR